MAAVKASASPSPKLFADSAFDGAGRRGGRGRGRVDVKVSAGICKQSTFKLWSIKSEPKLARISVCRWKREDEDGLVACKAFASARSSASVSASTVTYNTKDASPPALPFRIGHGFDLHRLEPNLPLIIGGINIPHDRGCEAHSDGDVLLHCIVDAILGALGLPDIGQIFPDTDPKWKGATSSVFVKEAVRLMHEAGYELGNLDATLILQRPKLSPHKEVIQSKLCVLLGASSSVINIKAKTHEKVDSLGENRSIAAHTVVLLMKK